MVDPFEVNRRNWDERASIHARDSTGGYRLDRDATTYTGDPTVMANQSTREWIHSVSAILSALIDAGLTITMFHEHEVLPWQGLPSWCAHPIGYGAFPTAIRASPCLSR